MSEAAASYEVQPQPSARFWPIVPVPAPRQVRRDRFNPSPGVRRYREFRDEVQYRNVWAPESGDLVVFLLPIPVSWSKRKAAAAVWRPHLQKPDVDNLAKALLDAVYGDDSHIWGLQAVKLWSHVPGIVIARQPTDLMALARAALTCVPG